MPFDWNDYFGLAQHLANQADAASKRTAVSRAYYSIFNSAFERAERNCGMFPGGMGNHLWCWQQFIRTRDTNCRKLGLRGDRIRRARVKADYKQDDITKIDVWVNDSLTETRKFQTEFAALASHLPCP